MHKRLQPTQENTTMEFQITDGRIAYQNEKADNEENPVYYKFYRDGYNGAIWMV